MKEDTISRVTRTRQEARASYDRLSSWYDFLAGSAEKKYQQAGLHILNVHPGEKVLEIGFGTGDGLLALAKSVNASGKVFGLDLSAGMARVAKLKLKKAGLSERVELLCGDAAALPYERNSLDAIFSSFTLELFDTPEIPMVLNQCHHVLVPNGRICLVVMVKKHGKQSDGQAL